MSIIAVDTKALRVC